MSFIDEIKRCFSSEEIPCEPIYRLVAFGDRAIYIENVRSIVAYSTEEIILGLKKGGLKITGECMYIKKFCGGDVSICGKINKIERIGVVG